MNQSMQTLYKATSSRPTSEDERAAHLENKEGKKPIHFVVKLSKSNMLAPDS